MNRMYTYPVDSSGRLIVAQTSHIPILKPQPPLPGGTVGVYRHKTRKQRAGWQAQTHGALLLSYEVERDTHVLHGYADYLLENIERWPVPGTESKTMLRSTEFPLELYYWNVGHKWNEGPYFGFREDTDHRKLPIAICTTCAPATPEVFTDWETLRNLKGYQGRHANEVDAGFIRRRGKWVLGNVPDAAKPDITKLPKQVTPVPFVSARAPTEGSKSYAVPHTIMGRQIGGNFELRKLQKPFKDNYLEGLWYYDETAKWLDRLHQHVARCEGTPGAYARWPRHRVFDPFSIWWGRKPDRDGIVAGRDWEKPLPLTGCLVAESKRTIGPCISYLRPALYTHKAIIKYFRWLSMMGSDAAHYFGLDKIGPTGNAIVGRLGVVAHCARCEPFLTPDYLSPEESQWYYHYLQSLPWRGSILAELCFQPYQFVHLWAKSASHAITEASSLDQLMSDRPTRAEMRSSQDDMAANTVQLAVATEAVDEEAPSRK